MPGSLLHSQTFRIEQYTGSDGNTHHEIVPVEGDYDFISYSTWNEIKKHCASRGVPLDAWPEFTDYPDTIDLPLDRIATKQFDFRRAMESLTADDLSFSPWLIRIAEYAKNGEQLFFC